MKSFFTAYTNFFKRYFPSPFTIAILLTLLTFVVALLFTGEGSKESYIGTLGNYWFEGMFASGLLAFTVQMMLILVLGHIIALSNPAQSLINHALKYCNSTASSVFIISLLTILVGLFNWGLGLIFGAIFARKIGEHFQKNNWALNYPLIGAAAYVGMMIWHGGLSGSAPLTVAGSSHSLIEEIGVIPFSETIFSKLNIVVTAMVVIILPLALYWIGKRTNQLTVPRITNQFDWQQKLDKPNTPAEKLEANHWLGRILGVVLLGLFTYLTYQKVLAGTSILGVLDLNKTNLLLLAFALLAHGSFAAFLRGLDNAIGDVSGILIQFPLYFGIIGIMKSSGLVAIIAEGMTANANQFTLPIYTYLSAALVNIFVPSGGGQWQIQGPIIAETAAKTGTSVAKLVMALSYGDQLTNMLQPFWALPLLGITGLKAKEILPYTLFLFVLGFFIFLLVLMVF